MRQLGRLAVQMTIGLAIAGAATSAGAADKASIKSGKKLEVEGQKALTAKDYATALQKFRSADSLNHTAAAELGQARALVGLGQLAQAQKVYVQLASEAKTLKPAPPAEAAKEAKKLDDRVPHVTVAVTGLAASAATITIDSEPVASDALSAPIAVDPGAHFAHGEAPNMDPVDQQFTVQEGDLETVTLAFHAAAATPTAATDASKDSASSAHGGKTRRTVGEVVLIAGAAGLVFGGVTGVLALGKHSSLKSDCPNTICTVSQTSAIETYHQDANLSTIGFIAGGALAAVGLVLTLLPVHDDPPKDAAPPPASASRFRFEPLIGLGMIGGRGQF